MTQDRIHGATIVSEQNEQALNERQLADYRTYKRDLLDWMYHIGKNPDHAEGYAKSTVSQITYRVDAFYRWLWIEQDQYTTQATPEDADEYVKQEVVRSENSNGWKAMCQKCLKRLFKYRNHELGETNDWEKKHAFSEPLDQPRDFLTIEERRSVREAALELGSVPHYNALSPAERDTWEIHLAQRFEKPKTAIGPADFKRANGWKVPSIVWTSLDTGLRPIEVGRAQTYWVDTENKMLRIPKGESSKNADNWAVAITDRTAGALENWLGEREHYEMYDETDALWLTRQGNPYASQSLRRLLHRLCEVAEIPTENRQMSWYTIRHSVGTYFAREEDLAAAQAQLRHKSPETTMRYDQAPVEDRRNALNRMG